MTDSAHSNLTLKQRKWLEVYIDTGNATEAAMQVYDCKDRGTAANIGSENVRKLQGTVTELMDFMGLTDIKLMTKLSDGLDAMKTEIAKHAGKIGEKEDFIDFPTRRNYLELALKLRGLLKDIIKHEGRIPVYTGDISAEEYLEKAISNGKG